MQISYIWPQQLIERNRARYQRALNLSREHELTLYVRGDKQINQEIADSVSEIRRSPEVGNPYLEYALYYLTVLAWVSIARLTKQVNVVHTFPGPSSLVGKYAKSVLGVKWVADILDDPAVELDAMEGRRPLPKYLAYRVHVGLLRRWLRAADAVFIIGWAHDTGLPKKIINGYSIPRDRVIPIPNGVDLDRTKPQGISSPDGEFKVLYLGSIQALRGISTLIESIGTVANSVTSVRLHLVGHTRTDQDKAAIEEELRTQGIMDQTVFTGERVPHTEALEEIESADVCVLPLTDTVENYNYTLPIKLFEYLALGKATVASDLVGVRQVIEDRENGILVQPDDADAMAKGIIELTTNHDLRRRLEANARPSVEKYDWKKVHEQVLATYEGFE